MISTQVDENFRTVLKQSGYQKSFEEGISHLLPPLSQGFERIFYKCEQDIVSGDCFWETTDREIARPREAQSA